MIDYCIYHKEKHDAFNWKNKGEGWYCDEFFTPSRPEFVGESIKEQRKEHAKSILQPYRDGVLSQEYLDAYGPKSLRITDKERKKARYVWKDVHKGIDVNKTK